MLINLYLVCLILKSHVYPLLSKKSPNVNVRWEEGRSLPSSSDFAFHAWEYAPEAQSLIASSSYDIGTTGTHWEVENSISVPCHRCDFLHAWIFPNIYLIKGVAVSGDDFVCSFREHQVTYLGTRINVVDWLQAMSVPEANASISGATSWSQETILIWVPCDCFHRGLMLTEFCLGLLLVKVPDHELVVVASRS